MLFQINNYRKNKNINEYKNYSLIFTITITIMFPKILFEFIIFLFIYRAVNTICKKYEIAKNPDNKTSPHCYNFCINNTQLYKYTPNTDRIITNIEFMYNEDENKNKTNIPLRLECKFYKKNDKHNY